ncbi:mitochondrial assembly of ribosomal large subunit protein 1 [Nasonia vitripennis]|uniref:Mitochondrial assembly of ribosomal large subunit protein 1 n=1 Tax=Nasonia vitripennis TaxID=7425 RepID=A0A7M7QUT5_NASVI|nr:mitochondrial assembly of ribosomal large subunit protein 1 [Nasonia vitripennis]
MSGYISREDLNKDEEPNLPSGLVRKYKVFRDEDAPVIFDVNEELKRIELGELNIQEEDKDPYEGINLEHGVNGVFDIEDLVELLKKDNARQIFVATVPKEYSYVDYIVVASGKSTRHLHALATFVRKIYKIKRHKNDTIPKIEGESSKDWMAMDLGNIALHLLTHEARLKYDLETLWSVGSQYDDISNKKDQDLDLMDKYSAFLRNLQPAE